MHERLWSWPTSFLNDATSVKTRWNGLVSPSDVPLPYEGVGEYIHSIYLVTELPTSVWPGKSANSERTNQAVFHWEENKSN